MRRELEPWVERHRLAGEPGSGPFGAFQFSAPSGMHLRVVVSDGRDWKESGLPGNPWEHVSVSLRNRTPTWAEMEFVRDKFFEDHETVIQFSVPRAKHINIHANTLHMWRPPMMLELPPEQTV